PPRQGSPAGAAARSGRQREGMSTPSDPAGAPDRQAVLASGRPRSRYEAHVPAEPPQARQDARLQGAHGDARRPPRPLSPQGEGPQAPDGRRSLTRGPKLRSLKSERDFQRLVKGRVSGSRHVTVRLRETRTGEVRVAVVVSRKVGKAVVRNRVRRRLREALL